MTEIERLIIKHRANGILVDANLLVLLLIGSTDRGLVSTHKRLSKYTAEDYDSLTFLLTQFQRIFTTPHILTETSNLATLDKSRQVRLRTLFKEFVCLSEEIQYPSKDLVEDSIFNSFGLTDTAIAISGEQPILVLTEDLPLWSILQGRGIDSINFNHLRTLSWQ